MMTIDKAEYSGMKSSTDGDSDDQQSRVPRNEKRHLSSQSQRGSWKLF